MIAIFGVQEKRLTLLSSDRIIRPGSGRLAPTRVLFRGVRDHLPDGHLLPDFMVGQVFSKESPQQPLKKPIHVKQESRRPCRLRLALEIYSGRTQQDLD